MIMTQEEKAKRFDEALEQLKGLIEGTREDKCAIIKEDIIDIFPELAESEDERIRKDIIVLVKDWWDRVNKDNISTKEQMLAWLEKPKPLIKSEWTEEDEDHWMMCLECVEECATQEREDFSKTISWLKQLKQRLEQ